MRRSARLCSDARKAAEGQHIDMALYDCMVSIHDFAVQAYTLSGGTEIPQQTGHDLPDSTLYGVFPAKDGYLVIAAQVDEAWKRLAKIVRRPFARRRYALPFFDGSQYQPRRDLASRTRLDHVQAVHQGVHCSAGRGRRPVRARAAHRRSDCGSAGQSTGDDRRARSPGPWAGATAEPPVPLLGIGQHRPRVLRHCLGSTTAALPRHWAIRRMTSTRWCGTGVLYAEEAAREQRPG